MVSVLLVFMLLAPTKGASSTVLVIFVLLMFVLLMFVLMIFVMLAPSVMAEKTKRRRRAGTEIMITVEEQLDLPGYICRCEYT